MRINLDADGYLNALEDWDESIARELATLESISLNQDYWELIKLVRQYYQEFNHTPAMRPLVKWIKLEIGPEKGNSIYLHKLFPISPAKQLARISGLPKPTRCL
jgi:TusE/DsrC/DsvC family sulfur relay protein